MELLPGESAVALETAFVAASVSGKSVVTPMPPLPVETLGMEIPQKRVGSV